MAPASKGALLNIHYYYYYYYMTRHPDGNEKHGLKLQLNAILLRPMKSLEWYYNDSMQDEKYEKLTDFRVHTTFVPQKSLLDRDIRQLRIL